MSELSNTSLSCETIRKERKERFFIYFLNAMFNRFLRRKLNPKLQECMISTLVGHSGFELSLYSEKDLTGQMVLTA